MNGSFIIFEFEERINEFSCVIEPMFYIVSSSSWLFGSNKNNFCLTQTIAPFLHKDRKKGRYTIHCLIHMHALSLDDYLDFKIDMP